MIKTQKGSSIKQSSNLRTEENQTSTAGNDVFKKVIFAKLKAIKISYKLCQIKASSHFSGTRLRTELIIKPMPLDYMSLSNFYP